MPNATIPLTSFTGGEWSPRLHARVDIAKYQSSCETLQNMIIYPHGGITRRMGMEYIEDAKVNDVRLIPFEYNREQAYVLEFGNLYIRFYRSGAQITSGGSPVEVVTPYTTAQLGELSFTQSADTLYIVHESHAPRKLTRTGPDTFSLNTIAFTATPAEWVASNYPRTVSFFQSRLVFAGLPNKPQTIWMSKSFDFENMTTGSGSSDALVFTLTSNQVNAIQWLVPGSKLLIGTTGGEWSIYGSSDTAVTGTNIQAKRESNFGSKNGRVQLVGTGAIYASRDGRKLREMSFSFESDGYVSPELSLFSEHLAREGEGIKEFDYAQNPDGILWVVYNDGSFSGFTYLKSQEVQAWHRHVTDGTVLSVCTIETDTGSEAWFAVTRNGATRIERMAAPFEGTSANDVECAYLDSYLTYSGASTSTLTGLAHLNGKTVRILGNGQYLEDKVVSGGSITLSSPVTKAVVGLPYEWKVIPLKLEGGSPLGFSQGKRKSLTNLVLRLERSAGLNHCIPGETPTPVPTRSFGENFNAAISLYSGDLEIKLNNSWDRDGQFELSGDSPFPVTILMISASVAVNE
jgi:hypothetical protein